MLRELFIFVLVVGWGIWLGLERKWEIGWFIGKVLNRMYLLKFSLVIYRWCWKIIVYLDLFR